MDRFTLWCSGGSRNRNEVGIPIDEDLVECVPEVKRISDRLMMIKLVIDRLILNVISAYAPQVGLDEKVKSSFRKICMR